MQALIDGQVLCVHGGLSPDLRTLDQVCSAVMTCAVLVPCPALSCLVVLCCVTLTMCASAWAVYVMLAMCASAWLVSSFG